MERMNVSDNPDPPAQRAGTLTLATRPTRIAPAILIREVDAPPPLGPVEIDVLGVAGAHLDVALERIRAGLERFAIVLGRTVTLTPVGHPDAPSGYLVAGLTMAEVERSLGPRRGGSVVPAQVTTIDIEGRW